MVLSFFVLPQNALRRDCNGKCVAGIESHYLEVLVEVYLAGSRKIRRGSRKFCFLFFFFYFSHHIFYRGEAVRTNILSGPPSAHQRNRWWTDDGIR